VQVLHADNECGPEILTSDVVIETYKPISLAYLRLNLSVLQLQKYGSFRTVCEDVKLITGFLHDLTLHDQFI